jgi:hypothetical protein
MDVISPKHKPEMEISLLKKRIENRRDYSTELPLINLMFLPYNTRKVTVHYGVMKQKMRYGHYIHQIQASRENMRYI